MYRGRGLEMFLKPLFKISCCLSYIFLITIHPVTFISIYDSTFFKDWIFILWSHEEVFDGMTSFKMYFYPIFLASSFEVLTQPLMVRYNNVWFWPSAVDRNWLVVFSLFFFRAGVWLFNLTLFSAQFGYLHFLRDLNRCFFFLLQLARVGTYCSIPMIQDAYHAVIGCNCMMVVPVQILVCVSWLPIDTGVKSAIFIWGDQHVKIRYGAIFSRWLFNKNWLNICHKIIQDYHMPN